MGTARANRGHTRDEVAHAAMRILDEYGLPDLTMRRLAAALEVQPSALYWHFPNKQSLLAELSDRIVTEVDPGSADLHWASRVRAEASALRRALLAHRDGAELVASTFALGLGSRAAHERLAAAIAAGGFDDESVRRATSALLHFVLGQVLHEQQRQQYRQLGVHGDPPGALRHDDVPEADFAFGVELLVGGLRSRRLDG
ncbi:TetR/AcrR family transcriptional regulator C-terminal domain-containing protein [Microbacterium sp. LWH3-1.2]|uniref:TetR/AcrR family transcriptional regulator C-terminal domain-containing protein n=1 Tax=Microbacterium sp. LWH3-1.2 TaxID=3135256 RepID=UPI003413169E